MPAPTTMSGQASRNDSHGWVSQAAAAAEDSQSPFGVFLYVPLTCAESPASSISSTGSLFSHNAPALPPGWLQVKDPEGRFFFMHAATQQTTWTFPASS